jgi:hypothetical protein
LNIINSNLLKMKNHSMIFRIAVAIVPLAFSEATMADIYSCSRPNGTVLVTDQPCPSNTKSKTVMKINLRTPVSYEAIDPDRTLPENATAVQIRAELTRTRTHITQLEQARARIGTPGEFSEADMARARDDLYQSCINDPETRRDRSFCEQMRRPVSAQVAATANADRREQYAAAIRKEEQRARQLEVRLASTPTR